MRWGKITGIASSMLSSALWRVYSNVRKVSVQGFNSCRSKSSSDELSILSSTSVVSVGRMSSYKWASELPDSFGGLPYGFHLTKSFSRPERPAVGAPSRGPKVSRESSRSAVCRMEEINGERHADRRSTWRTCKFGKVSKNWNMTRLSFFLIATESNGSQSNSSSFLCKMIS